jgi:hypothetical protein
MHDCVRPKTLQPINLVKTKGGIKIEVGDKLKTYTVDTRVTFIYNPQDGTLKPIAMYGRFNSPGKNNNIASGGGVCEVKVVQDNKLKFLQRKQAKLLAKMSRWEKEKIVELMKEELHKVGFSEKGQVMPFAPFPFLISESAFAELEKTAITIAESMKGEKSFVFALDSYLDPSPDIYNTTL